MTAAGPVTVILRGMADYCEDHRSPAGRLTPVLTLDYGGCCPAQVDHHSPSVTVLPGDGMPADLIPRALADAIALAESGIAALGCRECESLHGHRCPVHHVAGPRVTGYRVLLGLLGGMP